MFPYQQPGTEQLERAEECESHVHSSDDPAEGTEGRPNGDCGLHFRGLGHDHLIVSP